MKELIHKWRQIEESFAYNVLERELAKEAADTLESQQKRIAELEQHNAQLLAENEDFRTTSETIYASFFHDLAQELNVPSGGSVGEAVIAHVIGMKQRIEQMEADEPVAWLGLTDAERDKYVTDILDYGTSFVAPIDSVIRSVEKTLTYKNRHQAVPVRALDSLRKATDSVAIANATGNPDLYHDAVVKLIAECRSVLSPQSETTAPVRELGNDEIFELWQKTSPIDDEEGTSHHLLFARAIIAAARGQDAAQQPAEQAPSFNSLGIAEHWSVTVEEGAERVLCISSQHYAGVQNIEPYEETIKNCAEHLLSFIGASSAKPAQDKDAKDAERYRWLREQVESMKLTIAKSDGYYLHGWSGDDPDSAIDKALAAQKGGE